MSAVGRVKPDRLVDVLKKQYEASEFEVGRVVQSASEAGILAFLMRTDEESLHMALDVAAIGSMKQMVNLEDVSIVQTSSHYILMFALFPVARKRYTDRWRDIHSCDPRLP